MAFRGKHGPHDHMTDDEQMSFAQEEFSRRENQAASDSMRGKHSAFQRAEQAWRSSEMAAHPTRTQYADYNEAVYGNQYDQYQAGQYSNSDYRQESYSYNQVPQGYNQTQQGYNQAPYGAQQVPQGYNQASYGAQQVPQGYNQAPYEYADTASYDPYYQAYYENENGQFAADQQAYYEYGPQDYPPDQNGEGGKRKRRSFPEWFKQASLPKKILSIILGIFLVCVVAGTILSIVWLQDLPEYDDASAYNTIQPTEVYASDHETLLARFQFEYRIPLSSLSEISTYAAQATVATEDERFYKHVGIDPIGIGRALLNNMTGGTLEGASTITQQLVRNTILADEMSDITLKRKVREAFLALQMERLFSKDEILLLYMNTINYGNGAYGIEAAARRYLNKHASELTLSESALLAGIPQSPTYNNPIDFPDHALERRNIVLDRMVSYGAITEAEARAAKAEPIVLDVTWESTDGIEKYEYFSSYVREMLTSSYGLSTADVFQGGMKVYTTLDVNMQEAAEAAADEKEKYLNDALEVAIVSVEPDTGYVKAMVGGKDYREDEWNLAAQAQRQAGSAFKTFTLIAALEAGISPQTAVDCTSMVQLPGYEHKVYNYDEIDYGTQTIAGAFAVSSNTGFTRIIYKVGADKVAEVAHRMGIESDLAEVPSLTLGTSGVTPLEMASAYATIANGGKKYKTEVVEIAYDRKGNVVIDNTNPEGEQVLTPEIAHAAEQVMEGVIYSSSGTGTAAKLTTGQKAAGKTGTSENYLNLWFCGITPQLSTAVWMGDRDNKVSCSGTVADVFSKYMSAALADAEIREFPTAATPKYTWTFSNADLDIEGLYTSKMEEEEKKKEEEEKAKEEEAKKKAEEEAKKKEEAAKKEEGKEGDEEDESEKDKTGKNKYILK